MDITILNEIMIGDSGPAILFYFSEFVWCWPFIDPYAMGILVILCVGTCQVIFDFLEITRAILVQAESIVAFLLNDPL